MKPPAFQFYADDFLGGVLVMNNEERGLYITCLCIQWSAGFISNADVERLAVGMPPHSVGRVLAKFVDDGTGALRNARMEHEREKQDKYRKQQAENAKKRWVGNAAALPADMPNTCSPSPSPSPSPVSSYQSPAPAQKRAASPQPTCDEQWLNELAAMDCYAHLNIRNELQKATAWTIPRRRQCTRRFFLNWLNRASSDARTVQAEPVNLTPPGGF